MSPFSFGDDPLEENEFVTVTCSVLKGDLPITISWKLNGQPLTSNDEVTITPTGKRMSVLVIESVKGHHAGTYSCVGRSEAGEDVHSSDLLVNGWHGLVDNQHGPVVGNSDSMDWDINSRNALKWCCSKPRGLNNFSVTSLCSSQLTELSYTKLLPESPTSFPYSLNMVCSSSPSY